MVIPFRGTLESLQQETEVISKSDIFPKQVKYPNKNLKEIKLKALGNSSLHVNSLHDKSHDAVCRADLAAFMSVNATASVAKSM